MAIANYVSKVNSIHLKQIQADEPESLPERKKEQEVKESPESKTLEKV